MKGAILIATLVAAVALGACRREVEHTPMKLGADVAQVEARSLSDFLPAAKAVQYKTELLAISSPSSRS